MFERQPPSRESPATGGRSGRSWVGLRRSGAPATLFVATLFLGCSGPATGSDGAAEHEAEAAGDTASALPVPLSGRELYEIHCLSCHGPQGRGNGPLADLLPVRPADVVSHLDHHPDHEIVDIILRGIRPAMPPAPIDEAEAVRIVGYIRSFPP